MRVRFTFARSPRLAAGVVVLLLGSYAGSVGAAEEPPHSADLDAMIVAQAKRHGIPEELVRRVVMRESRYNPRARNHHFWGLMQISYPTARSMGFRGTPQELLNPLTNLTYAVPYLANAFVAAGQRQDAAIRLYARGYYDTARHRGLLGSLRTAESAPVVAEEAPTPAPAAATSFGIFGALFGPSSPPTPPQMTQTASAQGLPAQDGAPIGQAPAAAERASTARAVATSQHGKGSGGDVAMVVGKTGRLAPPKKWLHDGGLTVLARGEQSADRIAAETSAAQHDEGSAARHTRKNTQFAALDTPASAQAYAATASDAPPASQAAITQAISSDPASSVQQSAVAQGGEAAPAGSQRSHAPKAGKKDARKHHGQAAKIRPAAKGAKAVAELQP